MLDFIKNIQPWVWTVAILIAFMIYYVYRNIRVYNKNRDAILEFQNKLEVGSRIIMSSGIHGVVKKIDKHQVVVEIAPKVEIVAERFSLSAFEEDVKAEQKQDKADPKPEAAAKKEKTDK